MNKKRNFTAHVKNIVRGIKKGSVLTYQEVAQRAGNPRAYRAVGTILSKNYDPKIPCHRVVRSDGGLGGYNRGLVNKILILKKEGVSIINGKVLF